jgi:hypothetical protein
MEQELTKDPDARLDYAWSWVDWLAGDTIESFAFEVDPPNGVTIDEQSINPDKNIVVAWIAGGVIKTAVGVTCHIVTTAGRVDDRTISLWIDEQ